jgi:predicted Na+-dependent transporter
VNPGPASTIYRGLAAVNVAGVIVSMVFSIVLLPSLLRLVYERKAPAEATDVGLKPDLHGVRL